MLRINGAMLQKMILAGAGVLNKNKDEVDALNVFPVPDGDTGTNMSLTVEAAANEANRNGNATVAEVAKAAASGALRGARGNSGVILSQLFRGFSKGLEGLTTAGVDELADALQQASDMAYKAVMKPKEGTILSVARAIAEKGQEVALFTDNTEVFMREIIEAGMDMLERTTEMLPQLKQAGVVDAGGQGLLYVMQGAFEALTDTELKLDFTPAATIDFSGLAFMDSASIEFGYCTELFIHIDNFSEGKEAEWKQFLSSMGDSIVLVSDEDLVKIHVHTNHPGSIIEKALQEGFLSDVKIDNMRMEHEENISFLPKNNQPKQNIASTSKEIKDFGFVAVSLGDGLNELFKSLGVDVIIEGGQTMNPSTEDILVAIEAVGARDVFVLPNNSNIILAANQARDLCETSTVHVVPTTSISQGFTALCEYLPGHLPSENVKNMTEAAKFVKTGEITYAVRSTILDDIKIKEGDYLGLIDGVIAEVTKSIDSNAFALLDKMIDEDSEIISIFYGEDMSDDDAKQFFNQVEEKYPRMEVEIHRGGQPLYYYLLAVE